jgi:hypothetical protein
MLNDAATAYAVLIPLTIGVLAWVLILFDWLGRRRDRRNTERPELRP